MSNKKMRGREGKGEGTVLYSTYLSQVLQRLQRFVWAPQYAVQCVFDRIVIYKTEKKPANSDKNFR